MKVFLNQLLFYQTAAKASTPSVRMHKRKGLLFMLPFQLVGGGNYFAGLQLWWINSLMC